MNAFDFQGIHHELGLQSSSNSLQQDSVPKSELNGIGEVFAASKQLKELTVPTFLKLKRNDPKVRLSQQTRELFFNDLSNQDDVNGFSLENRKVIINEKVYVIEDGVIVFSMNGDLRIIQVGNYISPFTVLCGKCDCFEHKPILICRENYTNNHDGVYVIPDIFMAKLIAHRDKPDSEKHVSFNFSYLGSADELETPSRATESPTCKATATLLRVVIALIINHNLNGGELDE